MRKIDALTPIGILVVIASLIASSYEKLPGRASYYLAAGALLVIIHLALLLVGGAFIALGLFLSTLTRNQIIAGILGFGLALIFWVLGWLDQPMADTVTKVVAYLGVTNHIEQMMKGVVDLKDLVFYASFTAFGIVLAHQSVLSQRWRA